MQTDQTNLGQETITHGNQPPPKPAKEEKPKERTAEQKEAWEKVREKAHSRMFPNAKKEEKKDDKAKEPAKEEKATTEKKETAKAEEKKPEKAAKESPTDGGEGKQVEKEEKPKLETAKKEAPAPSVDYEKLATSVATATAKAIKESTPAKEEKNADDDVPEARRRDLSALEYLEANNPRYKGKKAEYVKFAKAEADYISKWEKDNPGRKFDADDEDHSAFYDRHEPEIHPRDLEDARVELAADRRAKALFEKESGSTRKELEEIKLQRDLERSDREVPMFVARNIALVSHAMGEDVAKAMSELKADETLEEKDPAAHAALVSILPDLHEQTKAAAHLFGTEGRAYNAKNPAHQAVARESTELEKLLLAQPESKLTDKQGRKYAKLDDWANMTPEQKANHWTINGDLMAAHLANRAAEKAETLYKTEREKAEKLAKAYGYVKAGASDTAQDKNSAEHEESEPENGKLRSPSTSSKTIIQPGVTTSPKTAKTGGDRMLDRMYPS
jgi:hypothetical protein